MDWNTLYETLSHKFDIHACLDITRSIWETDRWCTNGQNERTARFCLDRFRAAGLSQAECLHLRADGKTKYLDWTVPRAWDADSGVLSYADGEIIADYQKNPCSLVMYSPATPAGGITAQVVIPRREAPEKVAGKVLLISEPAADWVDFAQKNGAVGILSDYIRIHPGIRDHRDDLRDEVMWMGMGTAESVFGFHLTPRQGDELRRRLGSGPVSVHAQVSSRRYDGVSCTVSAALEGTDPAAPEILLYGHLYEPGANDNACGAAAIVHLAEVFARAVREGTLPRQKNTLRFVLGAECGGSMGYMAAHSDRSTLCAMVVDMVGTEQGDNAILGLTYNPIANQSFADGALFALHKIAGSPPCDHQRFAISTDNILADPSLGCPTVAIGAAPALSYHSSMDRPDRLEPQTLKRNALIAGTYAWGLATADESTRVFLEDAIAAFAEHLSSQAVHPRQKQLFADARSCALHSVQRIFGRDPALSPEFFTEPAPEYARAAAQKIPRRTVPGVLKFQNERYCAAWNRELNIPLFWADGKRNLWQIAYLSAAEKGLCSDSQLRGELELLTGYFESLAENGYLYWL